MNENNLKLKALIVDNSSLHTATLRTLLLKTNCVDQVSHAGNFSEAIYLYTQLKPDILLLDLIPDESSKVNTFSEIKKYLSGKIIILTAPRSNHFKNQFNETAAQHFFCTMGESKQIAELIGNIYFQR